MPRLRLFILWIVCVCVPLQGHAAAAMASCGPGHPGDGATATASLVVAASRTLDAVSAVVVEQPAHGPAQARTPVPTHAETGTRPRHDHGHHVASEALATLAGPHEPGLATVAPSMSDPAQGHGAHPCHDGVAHVDTHADTHDGADPGAAADAAHACGTCAACHAAALTGRLDVTLLHDLPSADLAEPALAPATRVPRVLDRPPRA